MIAAAGFANRPTLQGDRAVEQLELADTVAALRAELATAAAAAAGSGAEFPDQRGP